MLSCALSRSKTTLSALSSAAVSSVKTVSSAAPCCTRLGADCTTQSPSTSLFTQSTGTNSNNTWRSRSFFYLISIITSTSQFLSHGGSPIPKPSTKITSLLHFIHSSLWSSLQIRITCLLSCACSMSSISYFWFMLMLIVISLCYFVDP